MVIMNLSFCSYLFYSKTKQSPSSSPFLSGRSSTPLSLYLSLTHTRTHSLYLSLQFHYQNQVFHLVYVIKSTHLISWTSNHYFFCACNYLSLHERECEWVLSCICMYIYVCGWMFWWSHEMHVSDNGFMLETPISIQPWVTFNSNFTC